jgi:hypothetical protein
MVVVGIVGGYCWWLLVLVLVLLLVTGKSRMSHPGALVRF